VSLDICLKFSMNFTFPPSKNTPRPFPRHTFKVSSSSSGSSHFIFHKCLQDVEIVIGNNQRENNKV